jgi:uncharacterized membrane protein
LRLIFSFSDFTSLRAFASFAVKKLFILWHLAGRLDPAERDRKTPPRRVRLRHGVEIHFLLCVYLCPSVVAFMSIHHWEGLFLNRISEFFLRLIFSFSAFTSLRLGEMDFGVF